MPEGDTVFRTARRLHEALAGAEVTRFDLRVPRYATADLTGELVHEVVPRGKHLLMRIGGFTLHSHLKMEGRWLVFRRGERWRSPAFQARAIVGTAQVDAVGFEIAMVDLVPTSEEDALVGHLGPDLLGPDWDPAEAARRLSADGRPVHVAVLDQRNLAGLGNEYANELLFVRGILPTTPAADVDVAGLVDTAARMITANRDRPSRTFTGDTRPGRQNWVYRRERKPCRRCGTPIRRTELGATETSERIVFWCPVCQT
ncbi:Fpg/Nei family DNA glycosylase [Microbacterium hominis]|uniref:Fpg/Nei family DNA glycosylase n=1 Tax=Microbacterium TaxID=33882 RepID=UPI00168B3601|nr:MULTISPECIES: Fpg/Nei family DNA glycosylase [Microbacterium]QOC26496.1 Fpg/Nei family DNA glycosylase [Microbacterium hominis]QOC27671.1 Fpg/Nei family DNA glycosylase [Microbacterium hominis]QYF97196.1 Fpg/Nei family DNA glycosylase [Microbacterium sp. PAMC21962]